MRPRSYLSSSSSWSSWLWFGLVIIAIAGPWLLCPSTGLAQAPVDVSKEDMKAAITAYINNSAKGGKSTEFMLVATTDFIQPALDWTNEIKIDPAWLNEYKGTEQKGSVDGVTIPKAMFRDYSGCIVLREPLTSEFGKTAFHELIHAYHFSIGQDVDADATGGAEYASGIFAGYVGNARRIDKQIERVIEKIKAGEPYEKDLANAWKMFDLIATDMATWEPSVKQCIENIGGKADIEGLRAAYSAMIEEAKKDAKPGGSGDSGEKPGMPGGAQRTKVEFDVRPGDWLSTGIQLKKGQSVNITAEGQCKHPGKEGRTFGPGGYYWLGFQAWTFKAKMGSEPVADIGESGSYTAPIDGVLLLGMSGTYEPAPVDSQITGSFKATVEGEGIQSGGAAPLIFAAKPNTPIAFHVACPVTVDVTDAQGNKVSDSSSITSKPDDAGGHIWHGDLPDGEYTLTITGTAKGSFTVLTKQKGKPVFAYPTAECDKGTVATVVISHTGDPKPLKTSDVKELTPTAMGGGGGGSGGDASSSSGTDSAPGAAGDLPPELTVGKGLKVARFVTFRKITNNDRGENPMVIHGIKISADGSRIAFSSRNGTWVVNPDGSGAQQLSTKPSTHVDISNDGGTVAWFEQSDQPAVYAVSLSDGEKVKMPGTFVAPNAIRLSGDGSKLFVTEYQKGNIFVMPTDGSDLKTVITAKEVCALLKIDENWNHWREHLDVSDDGSRVVFNLLWDVFGVNADGSGLHRLTEYENYAVTALAISGDGQRVVHHRGYGKEAGVIFQNFDGGAVQRFAKIEEAGGRIDASPDGSIAYFSPGVRVYSADGKMHFNPCDIGNHVWANPWGMTMTADGKRGCFAIDGPESVDQGRPSQIVIVDFEPSSFLPGAPVIGDIKVTPKFLVSDQSNMITVTAKSHLKAKELNSIGVVLSRDGVRITDTNMWWPMRDDGQRGDETADDLVFTTSEVLANSYSGKGQPAGPVTIRLHLLDKSWNLTVVDLEGVEIRTP